MAELWGHALGARGNLPCQSSWTIGGRFLRACFVTPSLENAEDLDDLLKSSWVHLFG
jgi:hypothetical protein